MGDLNQLNSIYISSGDDNDDDDEEEQDNGPRLHTESYNHLKQSIEKTVSKTTMHAESERNRLKLPSIDKSLLTGSGYMKSDTSRV